MTPQDSDPTLSNLLLGAPGGIGESLYRRLASCGTRKTIAARNVEKLLLLANELHASAYPVDATRF